MTSPDTFGLVTGSTRIFSSEPPYSLLRFSLSSPLRDTYISLRHLRFGRCHEPKPPFGIVMVTENFPVRFSLKIIFCDDFQADG